MQAISRPSCLISRSIVRPSPPTQKRKLFSISALGITGMHEVLSIFSSILFSLYPHRRALTLVSDCVEFLKRSWPRGRLMIEDKHLNSLITHHCSSLPEHLVRYCFYC